MQTILEKACQTLAGENMAAASGYTNCPSLQDLNLYGGDQLQLQLQQQSMENNTNICHGQKRPSSTPYSGSTGKSPIIWPHDLHLQELGNATSCIGSDQDHDPFKGDHDHQTDSAVADIYELKPMLSGDDMRDHKKFDASSKLDRTRRSTLQT